MKQIALWTFVVVWFWHLLLGAGAGYAILRLWANRKNPLISRLAIFMHATPIGALTSIVLVFLAKGVHLTWKFAIAWFVGTFVMDVVRVPLILYLIRGRDGTEMTAHPSSGAFPPEYWEKRFNAIERKVDELKR